MRSPAPTAVLGPAGSTPTLDAAAGLSVAQVVPGDPAAVRELAGRFQRDAADLGDQVRRLRPPGSGSGSADGDGWSGAASTSYRSHADRLRADLEALVTRWARVAAALLAYAGALDAAQRLAARALAGAAPAGCAAAGSPSGPDPELLRIRSLLAAAREDRDRAAARCARALAAAESDRLRDPSGWHRLLGAVSRWAGRLSAGFGVAAVALVVVPGLGELLGAAALGFGALALAADGARWTTHDPTFRLSAFVVDALALVPAGRALRAAALVPEVGAAARWGGAIRGVPTTAGTVRLGARQLADGVRRAASARSAAALVRAPGGLAHELATAAGHGPVAAQLARAGVTTEGVQTAVGVRGLLPSQPSQPSQASQPGRSRRGER